MKEIDDRVIKKEHRSYDEFLRAGYVVDLDVGDKVQIKILDKNDKILSEKEFVAKYVNCHINCQWQDKGIKKLEGK